jgi:hypothetical protein
MSVLSFLMHEQSPVTQRQHIIAIIVIQKKHFIHPVFNTTSLAAQ